MSGWPKQVNVDAGLMMERASMLHSQAFVELKFTDYVNDAPGACSQSVSTIRLYLDLLSPAQPSCGPVIWNFKITNLLFFQKKYK